MAEKELKYRVEVETGEATKNVKNLNEELNNLESTNKKGAKSFKGLKYASELASKGIKGIGTSMKVAGIGFVVSAIASLMAVFKGNQKIVDTLSTALNTLQLGFNALSDVVSGVFKSVSEATGGFESLKKVGLGLINLVLTPLRLQFNAIKLGLQGLRVAYEQVFGDDESVEKAKADLKETQTEIKKLGKDFVQAGKDVVEGFGGAVGEIGDLVSGVAKGISNIDVGNLVDTAKAMTELANSSKIAEARITGLIEQYDRQAEKLRQVRDEERLTIEERREANNELKKVLEEQSEAMLRQADIVVANARAQLNANKSIENEVALISALNERKGVLAQIEGFISEQKINDLGLDKEAIELINSKAEAENSLAIQKKRFLAEQISDDEMRIDALKSVLEEERLIELQRLEDKKALYKEGTQAYVDAEIELNAKKQEFYEAEVELENKREEANKAKSEKEAEEFQKQVERLSLQAESDLLNFETKRALLEEQRQLLLNDELLTEEERQKALALNAAKEGKLEEQKRAQREETFNKLIGLVNAESNVGKALLVAKSIIQARELFLDVSKTIAFAKGSAARSQIAVAEGVAQTAKIGFPQNIPMLIGYAAQAAGIISSIKSATKSASSISIPKVDAGSVQSTSFNPPANLSQQSNIANINQQSQPNIVQAYVVSNDITNQQSLDRNILSQASI